MGLDDKVALPSLDLDGWCENIMELKAFFHTLDFHRVFREHSKRADSLSKEVLPMAEVLLSFIEYYEEIAIGEDKLQLSFIWGGQLEHSESDLSVINAPN